MEFIPYFALGISVVSLWISIHVALRDRSKIKTKCTVYHPHPKHGGDTFSIELEVVNVGRRLIILKNLVGDYDGTERTHYIRDDGKEVQLGEGEVLKKLLKINMENHLELYGNDEDPVPVRAFWFVDTLDRRHYVSRSKQRLKDFWAKSAKLIKERKEHRDSLIAELESNTKTKADETRDQL